LTTKQITAANAEEKINSSMKPRFLKESKSHGRTSFLQFRTVLKDVVEYEVEVLAVTIYLILG
jgi:hypothetical protein